MIGSSAEAGAYGGNGMALLLLPCLVALHAPIEPKIRALHVPAVVAAAATHLQYVCAVCCCLPWLGSYVRACVVSEGVYWLGYALLVSRVDVLWGVPRQRRQRWQPPGCRQNVSAVVWPGLQLGPTCQRQVQWECASTATGRTTTTLPHDSCVHPLRGPHSGTKFGQHER